MRIRTWFLASAALLVLAGRGHVVMSAPVPVPLAIDRLTGVHEDEHLVLPVEGGTPLGSQRIRAWRDGEVLHLELDRHFSGGERSRERATARINGVLQPLGFHKRATQNGETESQDIDFEAGVVKTVIKGETRTYTINLPSDTYVGPMLAIVMAEIAARPEGMGEFSTLALTPEPKVYKMRAEVVGNDPVDLGVGPERAYEVLLRVDLGPFKNMLLGSFVPAHHFWFSRGRSPEFLAFRGTLGYEGPEVRILRSPRKGVAREASGSKHPR